MPPRHTNGSVTPIGAVTTIASSAPATIRIVTISIPDHDDLGTRTDHHRIPATRTPHQTQNCQSDDASWHYDTSSFLRHRYNAISVQFLALEIPRSADGNVTRFGQITVSFRGQMARASSARDPAIPGAAGSEGNAPRAELVAPLLVWDADAIRSAVADHEREEATFAAVTATAFR
jgi:hypothetical protein